MTETPPRITFETVLGELGFAIQWSVQDWSAEFKVVEVIGKEMSTDPAHPVFAKKDECGQHVTVFDEAEVYAAGHIKWDGCSHFWFGDEGYIHICGSASFKKHIALMEYLYRRASEVMGRGKDGLDDPWDKPTS